MAMERWRPISGPSSVVDRWEPFRNLGEIQGEVNRLFDTFAGRPTGRSGSSTWLPLVDMHETTDDLVVTVEVAGVREKDIGLSITGDMLSIKVNGGTVMIGQAKVVKADIAASNGVIHVVNAVLLPPKG